MGWLADAGGLLEDLRSHLHPGRVTRPTNLLDMLADELGEVHGAPITGPVDSARLRDAYHGHHPRTALCLSGGGIRSAAFALGMVQWMAKARLLDQFHYLSTVSGGGYAGAWLSAWIHNAEGGYDDVGPKLAGRGADGSEAPEVRKLRANSQYLTPRSGITSGDTWAAVAITACNLVLNWLVVVPLVGVLCLLPQIAAALFDAAASSAPGPFGAAGTAAYFVAVAYVTACRGRWKVLNLERMAFSWFCLVPGLCAAAAWTASVARDVAVAGGGATVAASPLPVVLGVAAIHLAAWCGILLADRVRGRLRPRVHVAASRRRDGRDRGTLRYALKLSGPSETTVLASVRTEDRQAVAGVHYEGIEETVSFPPGQTERVVEVVLKAPEIEGVPITTDDLRLRILRATGASIGQTPKLGRTLADLGTTVLSGLVVGLCLSLVEARARAWFGSTVDVTPLVAGPRVPGLLVATCLGVPLAIACGLAGQFAFVAVTSLQPRSDEDREWLGRAAGAFLACGMTWLAAAAVVLLVPLVPFAAHDRVTAAGAASVLGTLGALSGSVTALLGRSPRTPASRAHRQPAWRGVVLQCSAVTFLATLAVALSTGLSTIVLHHPFASALASSHGDAALGMARRLVLLAVALVTGAVVIGAFVNVNRFSLHAMYRNRLIRAFLGASNVDASHRDRFTWFNDDDNLQMHRLWTRTGSSKVARRWRPFHVVNVALNVVSSRQLAWQERKAVPFVFTPLWCGAADLDAFRRASEYAGRHKAVTLGTAMAISGAAVSPNMGYNSSPLVTLLLTLFNVRLGWWYGNPRNDETYRLEGPRLAVQPLVSEALGLTTEDEPYVYLSDGGHFENLGLYEMIRRRCHVIVVCDAGHDPTCGFADLSSATRKIAVDLGVSITFPGLRGLKRRNDDWDCPENGGPGFTIGVVDYEAVDGPGAKPGTILYVKPTLRGDEPADVLGYAASNPDFPHDATSNQWFKESQFESYRSLACATMDRVLATAKASGTSGSRHGFQTLGSLLEALRTATAEAEQAST